MWTEDYGEMLLVVGGVVVEVEEHFLPSRGGYAGADLAFDMWELGEESGLSFGSRRGGYGDTSRLSVMSLSD